MAHGHLDVRPRSITCGGCATLAPTGASLTATAGRAHDTGTAGGEGA